MDVIQHATIFSLNYSIIQMKKSLFIFILISLFSSSIFAGGPWPKKKGTGFYKIAQSWIFADQHFTDKGLLDPNATFGTFTTQCLAQLVIY